MTNPIPRRERRDYVPFEWERNDEWVWDLAASILLIALVMVAVFLIIFVPKVSRAQETTPKKDYPLNNAGSCMRIHDTGMKVEGASGKAVWELCQRNGVTL